jgi:hypothetical protein
VGTRTGPAYVSVPDLGPLRFRNRWNGSLLFSRFPVHVAASQPH